MVTFSVFKVRALFRRYIRISKVKLEELIINIEKSPGYSLLQQRNKGPDAWQTFVEMVTRQLREKNDELNHELNGLQAQWKKLTGIA